MNCESCNAPPDGYDLHDYCEHCSKNLCAACLTDGKCSEPSSRKHKPAFHGMPTMNCPKCGLEMADFDGFGVLAHVAPMVGACGYCTHPSRNGDRDGNMVCGICGDKQPATPASEHTP